MNTLVCRTNTKTLASFILILSVVGSVYSRPRFHKSNHRELLDNPNYWKLIGEGERLSTARDSKAIFDLMKIPFVQSLDQYEKNINGSYLIKDGNFKPIESWETGEDHYFYRRMLFPVKRSGGNFNELVRVKVKKNPEFDDLLEVLKIVHPWATEERCNVLKEMYDNKDHYISIFLEKLSIKGYINLKLESFEEEAHKSDKSFINGAIKLFEKHIYTARNAQVAKSLIKSVLFRQVNFFIDRKINGLIGQDLAGARKKELEFLQAKKEKMNEIGEYAGRVFLSSLNASRIDKLKGLMGDEITDFYNSSN